MHDDDDVAQRHNWQHRALNSEERKMGLKLEATSRLKSEEKNTRISAEANARDATKQSAR